MQFIRQITVTRNSVLTTAFRGMTNTAKGPKIPRYTPQNQQILDDTMIPGPALRFFKTKREKKRHDNGNIVRLIRYRIILGISLFTGFY
jgi:hypothetical protein